MRFPLDRASQARRIRTDDVLADQMCLVNISTDGGRQATDVLTAWAIPVWLQGIKISRLAVEKRAAILAFKLEAADVLYRHFSQRHVAGLSTLPELPPTSTLVPADLGEKPLEPADDASDEMWADYYEQMALWWRERADLRRWQRQAEAQLQGHEQQLANHDEQLGELHSRIEGMEEVTRLVPEILERLGPQTLIPEHQATIKNTVRHLSELTGNHFQTIYADLNESFHVAKYDQIPEARWLEVSTCLKKRLDIAEKRRKH